MTINALLDSLQEPYEKLFFKSTVDHLADVYVNQITQFQKERSCLNAEGTGMQFCLMLASITKETINLWPGQNIKESILDEIIPEEKLSPKNITKKTQLSENDNFKKSLFSKRRLKTPSGEMILIEENLESHLMNHVVGDTVKLHQMATSVKNDFDHRLNALDIEVKDNSHAKSDLLDFFKINLGRHKPTAEEVNKLISDCLKKDSNQKCPNEELMAQYYRNLPQSSQGHFEDFLFRDIEESASQELKNFWRKDRKSTSVSTKEVTDFLLSTWEKNPKNLKLKTKQHGIDAELIEIEFNHGDKFYKFEGIICSPGSSLTCKDSNGATVQKNTLLTLYPVCGEDVLVFKKSTSQQIKKNPIAEFLPCN